MDFEKVEEIEGNMTINFSVVLDLISKIINHLKEYPGIKEDRRNILYILSTVTVFIQPFIQIVIPGASLARRFAFMLIAYVITLVFALVVGQQIRLRRWLLYLSPLVIAPLLATGIYWYAFRTNDVYRIAPDVIAFGDPLPYTSTYGTNARILEPQTYKRSLPSGPDLFIRLKFQLFCQGTDIYCNAGWIIGNLQGLENLNSLQEMVFEIRGAQGGEIIGVAIKDFTFVETRIFDLGAFVTSGTGVSTDWKTVRVPLYLFGQADFTQLSTISFFVDAQYTPYSIIDIDIANIRFE